MSQNQIYIVNYARQYAKDFARLNKAWLQKYFAVETKDEEMLSNPEYYYINKGGFIFFALSDDEVAGTIALLKVSDGVYELSKMAVDEKFQGNKIGNKLVEHCLGKAKELGANKVILYSNTALLPAIYLYEKYGFIKVPLDEAEYKRANIKMEIDIK